MDDDGMPHVDTEGAGQGERGEATEMRKGSRFVPSGFETNTTVPTEFLACCQKCGEIFTVYGRYVPSQNGKCMAEVFPHSRLVEKGTKAFHYLPPGSPGGGSWGRRCGRLILAPALRRVEG
jgi:hypothetical protein